MAKFELDNQMLIKLEKLCKLTLILNTMESEVKCSYQLKSDRIIMCVAYESEWTFPIWTYQRMMSNLTYPDLDQAIKEMNENILLYGAK